jgi:hypothetical protein
MDHVIVVVIGEVQADDLPAVRRLIHLERMAHLAGPRWG